MQTVFTDTSICIRPFSEVDGPALFAAARESIDQLCRWMAWCEPDYSLEEARSFVAESLAEWEKGLSYSFAVISLTDNLFLGSIALNQLNPTHKIANIGVWVRSSRTRQGIAAAAVRLVATFAFRELGLNRLEILVAAENQASIRMANSVRAKAEGILRNRLILLGKQHDAVMLSLIPEDISPLPAHDSGAGSL